MPRKLADLVLQPAIARISSARKRRNRALLPYVDGLERRELLSTVVVSGQANIYGAGLTVPPSPGGGGGGILPTPVSLAALGSPKVVDFPSTSGIVSGWAAAGGYNGSDGGLSWGGVTNVPAFRGISGIVDTHGTMFLVGVFLGPNGQPAKAPATPNVTNANNLASSSPLIGQQFFIGDGRTASQALQAFNVPAGATRLFLGFAENFQFSHPDRPPGYYSDNGGALTVDVESSLQKPVISITSFAKDSSPLPLRSNGNFDLKYQVSLADLPNDPKLTFAVYWATGTSASSIISGLPPVLTNRLIPAANSNPYTVAIPISKLINPPAKATNLVAVLDNNHILPATEITNGVASVPTPTLAQRIIAAAQTLAATVPEHYKYAYDWDGPGGLSAPSFKCNLLVYDALQLAGINVPLRYRAGTNPPRIYLSPPVANEWATDTIPGFTRIVGGKPQPGDVIILQNDAIGHMGIVSGSGTTISVASPSLGDMIVENDFGFRLKDTYVIQRPNDH